ncbi:hypothetical protein GCM10010358_63030 [Streptomyces minutiscleroticus]|uniref:Uncharacterized protein n=1 Tax=Streptomyces minutiscleroticus TaxID=68238 RepID=A0A918NWE5_9ACTN|nr:hypothetical protein [Streptomyces minutiscleroticus]GGY00623.1 hypothetical protein GCM10010358_63030 [Streptomyces minutiscleroticus]
MHNQAIQLGQPGTRPVPSRKRVSAAGARRAGIRKTAYERNGKDTLLLLQAEAGH